jgi:nucleotidyltransferase AbiEii toxin of type IV toxin-antitoxin system
MHSEALTEEGLRLFPALTAFDDFYLAGGTALALQIGHRLSVDFDLFCEGLIDRTLLSKVKKIFSGIPVEPVINNPDELTASVGTVKMTFLSYPFPVIEPLVSVGGLPMLSVKEIGATKAYTIGRRGTYKDYVDLYFIVAEQHASLEEIIAIAERKFRHEFNSRLFTEQLLFMDDVRDYDIDFLKTPVAAGGITAFFKDRIRKLPLA